MSTTTGAAARRAARSLRTRLAVSVTALALGVAALVAGAGALLAARFADDPAPVVRTRVEQVGDTVAVVRVEETDVGAAEARTDVLGWLLVALGVAFVPAALGAWLLTGRLLRPVAQVAEVAARVDDPGGARVGLGQRDDELGRLAGELDAMLDRLDEREREQRRRQQEVIHELRTPLAVVGTNLELAALDTEGEAADRVAAARRAVERMGRTVDDLARHGRLAVDAGAEAVDLAAEAAALAGEQAGPAASRGLHVAVEGEGALSVPADRAGVRTAVGNLLANAVGVAPRGSRVVVGWGSMGDWAWIGVRDEGPGIAAPDHARVFERHWRGRYERDRAGAPASEDGRGLGLTIARQVTEAQGGHVTVSSMEGVGSSFVVWLPRTSAAEDSAVVQADGVHPRADPLEAARAPSLR